MFVVVQVQSNFCVPPPYECPKKKRKKENATLQQSQIRCKQKINNRDVK